MEQASKISRDAIAHIYKTGDTSTRPIVQVCELKKISQSNANPNATPRFRLAISDGIHYQQAMLATQLNVLVSENQVALNCLIRLNDFICNDVQNKRILIILNLEVIAPPLPAKVGNPVGIDAVMNGTAPKPQQRPAPYGNTEVKPTGATAQDARPGMNQNNPGAPKGFGSGANGSWHATPQANPYTSRISGSGVMTKMESNPSAFYRPIQTINPYQNGWTIRGRCTFKSDLRKFQNHRGDGQVISFELTDDSGSIRITGFTQHAQIISDTVNINRIYKVSRGSLRQANPQYNRSTSSFEMTLDKNSVLEEIPDDGNFAQIKYNFTKIGELHTVEVKSHCDVVGVVTAIGPLSEVIIRSTGDPCPKRSITITDDSNASVELTLWRTQAENFLTEADLNRHPVLLLHDASRGDFGGVSLNVSRMSTMELDPVNIPEANKLRAWYDSGGFNEAAVQSMSSGAGGGGKITGPRKSLAIAKEEDVDPVFGGGGAGGATATFVTRAYVSFINSKNDLYYPSDPETKKKLTANGPGMWTNEATGRQFSDEQVVWRYVLSLKVMDHSSSHWISAFDDVGQILFRQSAQEFRALKERDAKVADQIVEDATFRPMLLKISVKERMWRDEQQIRYSVAKAEAIDFNSEGYLLLQEIKEYGLM